MAFNFFKKVNEAEQTPHQKAQRAQLSIGIRIVAGGYLIYLGVKLLRSAIDGSSGIAPAAGYIISILFILIAIFLLINLVRELIRNYKAGVYNEGTYMKDEEENLDEDRAELARLLADKDNGAGGEDPDTGSDGADEDEQ
ncbi:MAG: hypothetical protein IJ072_06295 [Oscillospiraceae bacterium]|nr:hypothetical protein [Oscillospiraceae bacterium]